MSRTATNVVLAAATLVVAGVVAWFAFERWRDSDIRTFEQAAQEHQQDFGKMRPGGTYELKAFPAPAMHRVPTFTVHLNSRGLREREFEDQPPPGVHRIIAVGESSTFGTGVEEGERFTELLAAELEAWRPGCCEVINAGRMGMRTERILSFLRSEVQNWGGSVLIHNSMANDLRGSDTSPVPLMNQQLKATYRQRLGEIVQVARDAGMEPVFWTNVNGDRRHPAMKPLQQVMKDVGAQLDVGVADLDALYTADPATPEEIEWYLDHDPWTELNPVPVGPKTTPIERAALHVDWVHPNRFGNQRLAAGLLPLVKKAILRVEARSAKAASADSEVEADP